MKRIFAIMLTLVMVFALAACGGGSKESAGADSRFVGEWIGVGGEAWGIALSAEDAAFYTLKLEDDGKATLDVEGEVLEAKWTTKGTVITLTVEELDISSEGKLEDGAIMFEDLMDLGIKIYFAKEGTSAADPSLYIPDADKEMLGTWVSYEVKDVLDEDLSDVIDADALVMNFNGDYTVDIELDGEMIVGETWTLSDDYGFLTDSEYDISWDVISEDEIEVSYYDGEEIYKFLCERA